MPDIVFAVMLTALAQATSVYLGFQASVFPPSGRRLTIYITAFNGLVVGVLLIAIAT